MRSDHFRTEVETVTIRLEQRFEYDATFLRDRFVYLARTDVRQGYSTVALPDDLSAEWAPRDFVTPLLPSMRRTAIDGALSLGYEADLRDRDREIQRLRDEVRWLRRPLRRKAADALRDFWWQIKAIYS